MDTAGAGGNLGAGGEIVDGGPGGGGGTAGGGGTGGTDAPIDIAGAGGNLDAGLDVPATGTGGAAGSVGSGGAAGMDAAIDVGLGNFACPTVINGSLDTSDGTQTGRDSRVPPASVCGSTKPFPGNSADPNGPHLYDVYHFVNPTSASTCFTFNLTYDGTGPQRYLTAYSVYDPANITTGYLGDVGAVITSPQTMSVTVPAGGAIDVVVIAIDGAPAGTGPYTLTCGTNGGGGTGGTGGSGAGGTGGTGAGGTGGGAGGMGGVTCPSLDGGVADGSTDAGSSDGPSTCNLSTSGFTWSSSGPLISPISDASHALLAVKDPSVVYFNNRWHVYASDVNTAGNYNMLYLSFTDWSQAACAKPYYMDANPGFVGYRAAPEVFFFAPQNKWYLIYQGSPPKYSTAADLSQPSTWTAPADFYAGGTPPAIVAQNAAPGSSVVWIDFWVICDDTSCYLFFENDNGFLFRSRTAITDFPNNFDTPVVVLQDSNKYNLFEASNVYKLKGTNQYLLLIEAAGTHRFFRSWTATALDGAWTPLDDTYANPFAGINNVTFSGTAWTQDISHGEMIRDGYDQTLTIDPCHMRYLYQGVNPANASGSYNLIPWQLGLLTQTN